MLCFTWAIGVEYSQVGGWNAQLVCSSESEQTTCGFAGTVKFAVFKSCVFGECLAALWWKVFCTATGNYYGARAVILRQLHDLCREQGVDRDQIPQIAIGGMYACGCKVDDSIERNSLQGL